MPPDDQQPPPLPRSVTDGPARLRSSDDDQRLAWPWKILLALCVIGICALVVRLIYANSIVKHNDAVKADVTAVRKIDKRIKELRYKIRLARNAQERSETRYLLLAEIKTLPSKLSEQSRNAYENMRAISAPLHEATLDYNTKVARFFGPQGRWLQLTVTRSPETLAETRTNMEALAAENQTLRQLYQTRIAALTRELKTSPRDTSLLELLRLSETKRPAYNLIRDSDTKIYETMDTLLQLLIANPGQWADTRPSYLHWKTPDLAQQSEDLFDELAVLFQQQCDAQLELLDLALND